MSEIESNTLNENTPAEPRDAIDSIMEQDIGKVEDIALNTPEQQSASSGQGENIGSEHDGIISLQHEQGIDSGALEQEGGLNEPTLEIDFGVAEENSPNEEPPITFTTKLEAETDTNIVKLGDSEDNGAINKSENHNMQDDGGFGDFNEEFDKDDDGFGDFNDQQDFQDVAPSSFQDPQLPEFEIISGDPKEEERIQELLRNVNVDDLIKDRLKRAFPAFKTPFMEIEDTEPFEAFSPITFDWTSSSTKQNLQQALLTIKNDTKQNEQRKVVIEENIEDLRAKQLEIAKRLMQVGRGKKQLM